MTAATLGVGQEVVGGEHDTGADRAGAPLLTGFTQFDPVEWVPATQRTEARVLLTDDAIYFAVTAWDDVEGGIRATLGARDSFAFSDDYVRFILDTFNDHRRGYVIMVNPFGVQDGLWVGARGRFGGWARSAPSTPDTSAPWTKSPTPTTRTGTTTPS